MSRRRVRSDQLIVWSDRDAQEILCCAQATPQTAAAPAAGSGGGSARLAHRALQTLRQTRVQMRHRSRARSQILSVGEFPGQSARDGLCAAGESRRDQRAHRQLPPHSRDPGADLRDQPRTAAASRAAVRHHGEPGFNLAHHPHRFAIGRGAAGQHARGLVRRRARAAAHRGGTR
jgi:hypothetical protein